MGGGGIPHTPLTLSPTVRTYQAYELFAKAHGAGVVVSRCWWDSCGENATMGYIKNNASPLGYTLQTEFYKKMKIWQKSQWELEETHR